MNFKRLAMFGILAAAISAGSWTIFERNLNNAQAIQKETAKLKASVIEYNNTSKDAFTKTAKLLNSIDSSKERSFHDKEKFKLVRSNISNFYFWLKKRNLPFTSQISDIESQWEHARGKADFANIRNTLNSYSRGLITRGVSQFSDREKIRRTISTITKQMSSFENTVKYTGRSNKVSLNTSNLKSNLEGLIKKLNIQRKYIMKQVANVMEIQPDLVGNTALLVFASGFIISLLFALSRQNVRVETREVQVPAPATEIKKVIETKIEKEVLEINNVEATFQTTKYPVLICSSNYSILWENKVASQHRIDRTTLRNLVKTIANGKEGLNSVQYKKRYYHFSINELRGQEEVTRYLVQLVPTEKPILGHSTIIDKSTLNYIRKDMVGAKSDFFELNSMMASLLTKTNFIFQLSGTVVDFRPFKEDRVCHVDRKLLEGSLRQLIVEVDALTKDIQKVKKISIELNSFENRLLFSFIIPNFEFTHESWRIFQGENPHSSERFLKRINEIECSMATSRSRITIRNVNYGSSGDTTKAAEICFSVENRDHRKVFRKPAGHRASTTNA